jgi:hypothetical protein
LPHGTTSPFSRHLPSGNGQILEQTLRLGRPAPPRCKAHNPHDAHVTLKSDSQDVARANHPTRRINPLRIDADMPRRNEARSLLSRFHQAGEPQPFVQPLLVERTWRRGACHKANVRIISGWT